MNAARLTIKLLRRSIYGRVELSLDDEVWSGAGKSGRAADVGGVRNAQLHCFAEILEPLVTVLVCCRLHRHAAVPCTSSSSSSS